MGGNFILAFLASGILSVALTPLARRLAMSLKAIDYPTEPRKIQDRPTPLLGGLAVYGAVLVTTGIWLVVSPHSFSPNIGLRHLLGVLVGGAILMIGGYLDDRYRLRPRDTIIAPVLAALAVIGSGVQLSYINNPLGGTVLLDRIKVADYPLYGGIFVFFWILGMIYTTKFLDGMDGLAAGTSALGGIILFFVSLLPNVAQSDTALLAIIFAGAMAGFLPWNFHRAKIFLGEGGSTFAGFMLGVLAVISGGKIATALLVMGIPILDVAWVIARRLAGHLSPFRGDRKHLHFRLLDLGLSHRQTVLFLYVLSAGFGASGIFLQAAGKVVALGILSGVMIILGSVAVGVYRRKEKSR